MGLCTPLMPFCAIAITAAAVCLAEGRRRVECGAQSEIPFRVDIERQTVVSVERSTGGRRVFTLEGGVRVVTPADPGLLRFTCAGDGRGIVDQSRVATGDIVDLTGALRGDGAVNAYQIGPFAAVPNALLTTAGLVSAVEYEGGDPGYRIPAAIRVGRRQYPLHPDAEVQGFGLTSGLADPVLPGDSVLLTWSPGAPGDEPVVYDVRVRACGEGSEVRGIITRVSEGNRAFVVSGLRCRLMEEFTIRSDPSLEGRAIQPGRRAVVRGALRGGVLAARSVTVDPASSAASDSGRARLRGRVDAVGAGRARISGLVLPLVTPVRRGDGDPPPRSAIANAEVGDIVEVGFALRSGSPGVPRLIRHSAAPR